MSKAVRGPKRIAKNFEQMPKWEARASLRIQSPPERPSLCHFAELAAKHFGTPHAMGLEEQKPERHENWLHNSDILAS